MLCDLDGWCHKGKGLQFFPYNKNPLKMTRIWKEISLHSERCRGIMSGVLPSSGVDLAPAATDCFRPLNNTHFVPNKSFLPFPILETMALTHNFSVIATLVASETIGIMPFFWFEGRRDTFPNEVVTKLRQNFSPRYRHWCLYLIKTVY